MPHRLPNWITVSRIAAAALLFAVRPLSALFFALYLYCGLSDVLDGFLARRTCSVSRLGARLDSVADLVFVAAAIVACLRTLPFAAWMLWWAGAIAAIRLATACIGYGKYRALAFLHTYANKMTGVLLFMLPLLYRLTGMRLSAWVVCLSASISALEELVMTLHADTLDRDARGLLWLRRQGETGE